jgi:hypothetical protein
MTELKREKMYAEYLKMLDVAKDVIRGKYGNGLKRIERLESAGYDSAKIQNIVNVLIVMRGKR